MLPRLETPGRRFGRLVSNDGSKAVSLIRAHLHRNPGPRTPPGLVRDGDPKCLRQSLKVPGSVGRTSGSSSEDGSAYSKHPHLPGVAAETTQGAEIGRHVCANTGSQPPHRGKLAILGGHIALPDEATPIAERMGRCAGYPVGLVRRILRASQNHFG